jgi:hypothetical protein
MIYKATNITNNKSYIGQTILPKLKYRIKKHLKSVSSGSKLHFHQALRKYGQDVFVWEVLYSNIHKTISII